VHPFVIYYQPLLFQLSSGFVFILFGCARVCALTHTIGIKHVKFAIKVIHMPTHSVLNVVPKATVRNMVNNEEF
jgi:hypothetical protein